MKATTSQPKTGLNGHLWMALRLNGVKMGMDGSSDVVRVIAWFIRQLPTILRRFPAWRNDQRTLEGVGPEAYWPGKLTKFAHRVEILGLESPEGRQAVFELMATTIGWCASIIRVYGPPPETEVAAGAKVATQLGK